MRNNRRANTLLAELLIVILFFMLAATILVRVFSAAYNQSRRAQMLSEALAQLQNTADLVYNAQDVGEELKGLGYVLFDDPQHPLVKEDQEIWFYADENLDLLYMVTLEEQEKAAGQMRHAKAEAIYEGETIITLPCSRYLEGT